MMIPKYRHLLTCIASICLLAPLLFNHKPLYIYYNHKHHWPFIINYSEKSLGGTLPTLADFTNPKFKQHLKVHTFIQAPYPYHGKTIDHTTQFALNPPSKHHWLGTNSMGQDILAYTIYAIRHDLGISCLLGIISTALGTIIGASIGYWGSTQDLIGQRVIEIFKSIPLTYLMIISTATSAPILYFLILYTLTQWAKTASIARTEALQIRQQPFIQDALSSGQSHYHIITQHLIGHITPIMWRLSPYVISTILATLNTIDFIGISLFDSEPSLGKLIYEAKQNPEATWILYSCIATYAIIISGLIHIQQYYFKIKKGRISSPSI